MAILPCLKRAKTFKNEVVTFSRLAILSRLKRLKFRKTEVAPFSRLDYWSMLDLFDRLPLHDLVRLNGLASWWSGYVTKVCRTKRNITVQFGHKSKGSGDDTQDQFNLIKVTSIHPHTSDGLAQLLPSITSLEIIIDGPPHYEIADISYLIRKWSRQLISLKIKCLSDYAPVPEETENSKMQFKQLLLTLNSITTLRRLTFSCKWWKWLQIQESVDLPILSQLEYFYFDTGYDIIENLRHSLVRYAGPNHALKQIVLPSLDWFQPGNHRWNDLLMEHEFVLPASILPKLTMLNLGHYNILRRSQFALLPNLTTVNLGFIYSRVKLDRLIYGVQCLKNLRNLEMLLFIDSRFERDTNLIHIDLSRQLPSVTNLKLYFSPYSYKTWFPMRIPTFKSLPLSTIFPNVQSVHLAYWHNKPFERHPRLVVKWMAKIWHIKCYRMVKRYMRQQFSGAKCTFEMSN